MTPDRPTNIRWLIVLMLMGFTFQGHFNRVSISVAGNERFTRSEGMSPELMGVVYSTFGLVYTLGMLPGGWVIDRLGPRRALTGMGLGMGFFVVLTGALGWLNLPIASLWVPLLVIRALAGACSVPLHPGAARSISLWIPLATRATANGLVTAGALLGIAMTYPGFGWLMDWAGWPLAFVISGVAFMLFALIWCFLATDNETGHCSTDGGEQNLHSSGLFPAPGRPALWHDLRQLVGNRSLVLLALSYAAVSYFQYLFFYWIEYYFEKELGLETKDSRQATFTVTIAMAAGMACGGVGSDALCRWFGRRWGCRLVAILGMGLSAAFAWVGISSTDTNQVVLFFSLALGSLGLCEGIFWTTAPLLQKRNGGLAAAFLNTIGNAGGFLAPVVTPWISHEQGWPAALAVACIVCGLGALVWLWIDPESPGVG
ncbi:MAG TPA: MFS transporter [Planctomycetaceae bacterium]|jgi:sugar phosphate permease